jgi:hypothetical protein
MIIIETFDPGQQPKGHSPRGPPPSTTPPRKADRA